MRKEGRDKGKRKGWRERNERWKLRKEWGEKEEKEERTNGRKARGNERGTKGNIWDNTFPPITSLPPHTHTNRQRQTAANGRKKTDRLTDEGNNMRQRNTRLCRPTDRQMDGKTRGHDRRGITRPLTGYWENGGTRQEKQIKEWNREKEKTGRTK